MSNKELNIELSDILDEILLSGINLSASNITEWTSKYPQFEREIMQFAAFEAVLEHMPKDEPLSEPEIFVKRKNEVRSIVQNAIAKKNVDTIKSFADEAKRKNLRFPQLAQKVGLSLPILANLEQRFVSFVSIPETIIENLSTVLNVSSGAIKKYLQMPPGMTEQASFKATGKPEIPLQQEDFFELVGRDRMLTPEQKYNLLKLKK